MTKRTPWYERLWCGIKVGRVDACWEWQGRKDKAGYGIVGKDGKEQLAHRLVLEDINGEKPKGIVRHTCDNPPCCNPGHLVVGTQKENVHDMMNKGRGIIGELHGQSKLSNSDIQIIRSEYNRNSGVLAKRFGVHRSVIQRIMNGKAWKGF